MEWIVHCVHVGRRVFAVYPHSIVEGRRVKFFNGGYMFHERGRYFEVKTGLSLRKFLAVFFFA
jgi:hypothetical protein